MRKVLPICMFAIFVLAIAGIRGACAQEQTNLPLHLLQTISIPGMKGRLDHLDVDVQGQRLFVSGLENGSVEALDLQAGKWLRRIPGFQKPQGIAYVAAPKITERTHEKATEALHAERESGHSEEAFGGCGTDLGSV